MKNFKRTISAILIAISLATTVSSFFVTETVYALTAKQQKAADEKACLKAYKMSCQAKKDADKAAAEATKAKEAELSKQSAAAAEKVCTDAGYSSCADKKFADDKKAAADQNSLTNGTFNVQEQLKLSGDNQPKAYFKGTGSPIVNFVMSIINYAITIMGAIAVILFIVAGFMFMAANGESQKLDNAKDIIKYAAIGLIVALLSYIITIFVQSIFANG
jgi:ABC-type multidrug transport system fused ATPase/permease subunit